MPKKRILFFVPLPPPVHGSNIMNQHVVNHPELQYVYSIKIIPLHYASSIEDIGRIRIEKVVSFLKYFLKLFYTLFTFKPDIIYFSIASIDIPFYRDCFYVALMKLFRKRVIYHLHCKGIKEKISSPITKRIYQWVFKNEIIILLSPLLYDDIKEVVHPEQIFYLPNGVPVPVHNIVTHSNIKDTPLQILFFSNLIESKGPITVLQASKILKDQGYDFIVHFVGNPSDESTYYKFNQLVKKYSIEDRAFLLGPKYGEEKTNVFLNADIFTFPTYFKKECWPLVLLEAMSYELPVVTTYEGAIPEIVDDKVTGLLVQAQNPEKLAENIGILIDHPEMRRSMGVAGKKKFLSQYTLENFNSNLLHIFKKVEASLQ